MKKAILIIVGVVILGGGVFALINITEKAEMVDQSSTPTTDSIKSESPDAAPLKQGEFMDADGFHKGSGTAQVIKTNQGNVVKFSDDFSVTNGPDLFVYFSKSTGENKKDAGEFVSLGKLQKTSGEQVYKLPDNIEEYNSVFVWCRAFKTSFAVASLK